MQRVIDGFPGFAHKDGLCLTSESVPDSYQNEHYFRPPYGFGRFWELPGTVDMDTEVISATPGHIEKKMEMAYCLPLWP